MTIPKFIEKAIEGGWQAKAINGERVHAVVVKGRYSPFSTPYKIQNTLWRKVITIHFKDSELNIPLDTSLLDPEFWKAVGVAEEWGRKNFRKETWEKMEQSIRDLANSDAAKYRMAAMPHYLWSGNTIEQYLETL